jgi:hypothetical protein
MECKSRIEAAVSLKSAYAFLSSDSASVHALNAAAKMAWITTDGGGFRSAFARSMAALMAGPI